MGGLLTTPRDLAHFVAAMLGAWPSRDGAEDAPALRRTLREMQTGLGHPDLWLGRRLPGGPVGAASFTIASRLLRLPGARRVI